MAKKGDAAKSAIKEVITKAFGDDVVGEVDKKLYVWVNDGNEKVQLAIAITMPKTPIGEAQPVVMVNNDNCAWATETAIPAAPTGTMSSEDEAQIRKLMQSLGIED